MERPGCNHRRRASEFAAELYNILAFHMTMSPGTIAPALVACVLWILVFPAVPRKFQGHLYSEGCDAGINCVAV
jgi:hypothetical protein